MTRTITVFLLALGLSATAAAAQNSASGPAATAASTSALLDLNTATMPQLEALPGIGRAMAERILEYRQKSGGFKKIEELMNVRGIGEKNFLNLKPLVSVSAAKAQRTDPE